MNRNQIILAFVLMLFFFQYSFSGELKIEGLYQGKNIYVLNPIISVKNDIFCISNVLVNGKETEDLLNSSAFEIDLSPFEFNIGDHVDISISYTGSCSPKILNPDALKTKSTFNAGTLKITKDDNLEWYTTNETGKLLFYVEQFRWNKWVKVAEVLGNGNYSKNTYSVKVLPNSGDNIFRVMQVDYTNIPRYSREKRFKANIPPIAYKISKNSSINFSAETLYEIYANDGVLILEGKGSFINVSELKKGRYYLNYDNTMDQFKIK